MYIVLWVSPTLRTADNRSGTDSDREERSATRDAESELTRPIQGLSRSTGPADRPWTSPSPRSRARFLRLCGSFLVSIKPVLAIAFVRSIEFDGSIKVEDCEVVLFVIGMNFASIVEEFGVFRVEIYRLAKVAYRVAVIVNLVIRHAPVVVDNRVVRPELYAPCQSQRLPSRTAPFCSKQVRVYCMRERRQG